MLGTWGKGKKGVWAKARGGSQGSPQSGQPDVAPSFPPDGWVCCSGTSCQAGCCQGRTVALLCALRRAPGEWGPPGGRGTDGESRRLGAGVVRGGDPEPQEACLLPRNKGQRMPTGEGCWRALRCVCVGGWGVGGVDWDPRMGVRGLLLAGSKG